MRLFEIATTETKTYSDFEEFMDILEEECSTIWNMYKRTGFLYRGIQDYDDLIVKSIRSDRNPTDLDPIRHNLSIEAYKKLGIAAHRGNSIFCSTDLEVAEAWGDTYIVFPTDPFKFSYLANWYSYAEKHLAELGSAIPEGNITKYPYFMFTYMIDGKTTVDDLAAILQEAGLSSTGLPMAISQGLEVLITGQKYYAVSTTYEAEVEMFLRDVA